MPLYEFACPQCLKQSEVVQNYDALAPACPVCDHDMVRQVSVPRPAVVQGGTNASYGKR